MTRNESLNWWLTAFLFWAAFLLVLEPGNVSRAAALGRELSLGREFARILVASLIGTAAMPVVLFLERRYPVRGLGHGRNAIWLIGGLLALAGVMNLVSCFVAAWGFEQRWLPSGISIRRQLAANWALLAFALVGLVAIVRVVRFGTVAQSVPSPPPVRTSLQEVIVKSGTRSVRVELAEVDWIEAQGNYVALHVGSRTHLHRQALKSFFEQLDTARFVRIHRSAVVALDRITGFSSDLNGEATLQLSTGHELRVSKAHRSEVRRRWTGGVASVGTPAKAPGESHRHP
jgi:two-component system LytT family response regulator